MTGYGTSRTRTSEAAVWIELKSVNSRYLDIRFNWPAAFHTHERAARACISDVISRGMVTATVEYVPDGMRHAIDTSRAAAYMKELRALSSAVGCAEEDVHIDTLLRLPGVVRDTVCVCVEDMWPYIEKGLIEARDALHAARKREGTAMLRDMRARLTVLSQTLTAIRKEAPSAIEAYQARILARLSSLQKKGVEFEMSRVLAEVGIFSERVDINEECVRLKEHIAHMRDILRTGGVCGKRIDFVLQEMFREITTIGNKASLARISHAVVTAKEEIERLREMAQNIE